MNLKKATETTVAGHYGEPDYRDPRPTSWLTGRQMVKHGDKNICQETGLRWPEKQRNDEKEWWFENKDSKNHNTINMAYSSHYDSVGKHLQN